MSRDRSDMCGLSEAERRLLDEFLAARDVDEARRRRTRRFSLRSKDVAIVLGAGATAQTIRAPVRDVSEGGLCFFHGVFVYPETVCTPRLVTVDGEQIPIPGKIVRCTHLKGRIHEIGVRFGTPIDVSVFVSEAGAERDMLLNADVRWLKMQESLEGMRSAFITRNLERVRECAREILAHSEAPAEAGPIAEAA